MKTPSIVGSALCVLALFLANCASTPQPASAPPPPPENVLTLKEVDHEPRAIRTPRPNYPVGLRRANISGSAHVRFVVTSEGHVRDVVVMEATHRDFGDAAVEAVSQWKYIAALKDGQPVSCLMTTPVVFTVNTRLR